MHIVQLNPTLTEIDGKVRVEIGPPRKREVATEELLSDEVTASHYQVGKPDALNKPIVIGEEMDYLDWKGLWVYHVYVLRDGKWQYVSTADNRDQAIADAVQLSQSEGA